MSEQPTTPQRPPLVRRADDRVIAGVCGAVARHLGIDPIIVRVVVVALAFAGGAGLLAYAAAWLLVPGEEGGEVQQRGTLATIAGAVIVVAAVAWAMPDWIGPGFGGFAWFAGIAAIGAALYYATRGEERPGVRRLGAAMLLLGGGGVLAFASFWTAALGGDLAVAIAVIVAGLLIMGAAVRGRSVFPAAWLALAIAIPAAFVGAAGLDLDGGLGEKSYRPAALTDIADRYELGAGELVLDLSDVDFDGATRRVTIDLGMGAAQVIVPEGVCVSGSADIGAGAASFLNREADGIDLEWRSDRRAKPGAGMLVVEADISLGALEVDTKDREWDWEDDDEDLARLAPGCLA
jgi:phage shock protein PspC (stress-responsive transcriptional regulator)